MFGSPVSIGFVDLSQTNVEPQLPRYVPRCFGTPFRTHSLGIGFIVIIKGSLAEKLPIYEQHRRVIESLRNSGVNYNRCVIVESSTIAA